MASITLKNIRKVYDGQSVAVKDFCLDIADREFIVLVGPSGCGKSTTLRMIAGLEDISGGELYINDRFVNYDEPKDRNIAMVFQNYALYPHMSVYDNIAFGLKLRKLPKKEIDAKVRAAAEILQITKELKKKPRALSGGQRQRVAIGRAIVREPDVFLMDEPLSNLDAKLRSEMRTEIIKLHRRLNTTFVYVTHDQTEAMTLGDRIVVMNDGYIMQVGTPQEVFGKPQNMFVAGFIGTPQMNFINTRLMFEDGSYYADIAGFRVSLPGTDKTGRYSGTEVTLGIRPENLDVCDDGIRTTLDVCELMGSTMDLHLLAGELRLEAIIPSSDTFSQGKGRHNDVLYVKPQQDKIHVFSTETGERIELDGDGDAI